jgi:hypothetical protein
MLTPDDVRRAMLERAYPVTLVGEVTDEFLWYWLAQDRSPEQIIEYAFGRPAWPVAKPSRLE